MNSPPSPPAWYPDPARQHEYRYFNGADWTNDVSDAGVVRQAPLGPAPPGLLDWHPPWATARSVLSPARPLEIPRVKMWILAVLSAFVFWINTPTHTIVLPLGIFFAIWCWVATAAPLKAHRSEGSSAVTEIRAARWVAVALSVVSLAQVALWTR